MAKRGQGEGTISKRPDGTWWARVTIGKDENGKQKRKAFYGKTRKEVQEKLTAALNDMNNNVYIEPSKLTVSQWLDLWINEYKKGKIRYSSLRYKTSYIKNHIKPELGNILLKDLKKDMVQRFVNKIAQKNLCSKTVVGIFHVLDAALQQAYENEIILKNPAKGIKLPQVEKPERRVFTPSEQADFIDAAKGSIYGKMFIFILGTGLRKGEALALTWDDINFIDETVKISKTVTVTRNPDDISTPFYGIGPTKTKASNRIIPLLPSIIDLLKSIQVWQDGNKAMFKEQYQNDNFVFCNEVGKRLKNTTVGYRFDEILKKIGLEKGSGITIHSLRHCFATRCLENGIELRVVQSLLGHSSINMTSDLYTHVLPDKKKDSILKLKDTIQL